MIGKRKISVWWLILAAWGGTALFLSVRDGTATSEDSGFIVELVCSVLRFFGAKIKGWQIHGAVRKAAHVVIHVGVAYFSYRAVRDTFRERNLLYTAAIGCAIGICGEVVKVFVPGRSCDLDEMLLNCATVLVCCLLIALWNRKAERKNAREQDGKEENMRRRADPRAAGEKDGGRRPKVLFVSSSGGHYEQLKMLKPLMQKYDSVVVTEQQLSSGGADYYMIQINHSDRLIAFKFLADCFKALRIWIRERPQYMISTGTMVALPFAFLAKLTRKKIIYIETFAKMYDPSMAGKLMYKIADLFIIQWESLRKFYPNAVYGGCIY